MRFRVNFPFKEIDLFIIKTCFWTRTVFIIEQKELERGWRVSAHANEVTEKYVRPPIL